MPRFVNQTDFVADFVPMIDRRGRNVGVVIVKATYDIVSTDAIALSAEQAGLCFEDVPLTDLSDSQLRLPSDLVDEKPGSDVVVICPRDFSRSHPLYGDKIAVEVGGVSFRGRVKLDWGFGPLARNDKRRLGYAGTYDERWAAERMPLLPEDFDVRFNHIAPETQRATGFLRGDETIELMNFHGQHSVKFALPGTTIAVAGNVVKRYFVQPALLDTMLLHLDEAKVELVWRTTIPCRQKIEEIRNLYVYDVLLTSMDRLGLMR